MVKVLFFFLIIYLIFKAGRFLGQVETKIKSSKEEKISKEHDVTNKHTYKKNKEKLEEADYKDL